MWVLYNEDCFPFSISQSNIWVRLATTDQSSFRLRVRNSFLLLLYQENDTSIVLNSDSIRFLEGVILRRLGDRYRCWRNVHDLWPNAYYQAAS